MFVFLVFCHASVAFQIFSNTTIPVNLTVSCSDALLRDVTCSPTVRTLQAGIYYPASLLIRTCTDECTAALATYETEVIAACEGQTWNGPDGDGNATLPVAVIPDLLRYHYNLTCLMDSGRYCNTVAANAAAADENGVPSSLSIH